MKLAWCVKSIICPKSQITNLPQGALHHNLYNIQNTTPSVLRPFQQIRKNSQKMEETSGRDTEEGVPLPGQTDAQYMSYGQRKQHEITIQTN